MNECQTFSGYLDGMVFSPYLNRLGINSLKKYKYPDEITGQNVLFGNIAKAVSGTWDAGAKITSYDLTNITINTFGGEIGDLLGTEALNVGNLVEAAGDKPPCFLIC